MVDFVYPQSGGPNPSEGFPSLTPASPSTRTYNAETYAAVQLPTFTAGGDGNMTITFTIVSEAGGFGTSEAGPFQPEYTFMGTAEELNFTLAGLWLKPDDGVQGTISYIGTIKNDAGDEAQTGLLQVQNNALIQEGNPAKATVTVTGSNGTIQLTANGKAISAVVPFTTSLNQTASALAASVNSYDSVPKVTATASGASITLEAALAAGANANNWQVSANVTGNMGINGDSKFSGGVTRKKPEVTLGDKLLDGALNLLPTLGAGLVTGLILRNTAKVEVTVPVTSELDEPDVAVVYDGIMVPVPPGYSPNVYDNKNNLTVAASYPGSWDYQTFATDPVFTSNPAWCLLEFVKNKRWGCGNSIKFTNDQLIRFHEEIWAAAQYCDQLVSDGYGAGGQEPRFTLNTMINGMTRLEALDAIASCMNASIVHTDEGIRLVQDRATTFKRLVTNANVIGGEFTKSGGSLGSMYNSVDVEWNNPDKYYAVEAMNVINPQSVLQFGEKKTAITAFGCTSMGQAKRKANYVLVNEQANPLMISYTAGLDHCDLIPGDMVAVIDNRFPSQTYADRGGRIVQVVNSTTVIVDRVLPALSGHRFVVTLPNGGFRSIAISSVTDDGKRSTVTLGSSFIDTPFVGSVFLYVQSVTQNQYKIISISERGNTYEVSAVKYDSSKYTSIDNI